MQDTRGLGWKLVKGRVTYPSFVVLRRQHLSRRGPATNSQLPTLRHLLNIETSWSQRAKAKLRTFERQNWLRKKKKKKKTETKQALDEKPGGHPWERGTNRNPCLGWGDLPIRWKLTSSEASGFFHIQCLAYNQNYKMCDEIENCDQ